VDHLLRIFVVDFAAQMANVDVHNIGEAVVVHVPDVLDDHGATERAAAIAHHVLEDAEFLRRELDVLVVACDFAANAIERKVAHLQALGRGLSTSQQHARSRQQFHKSKRLYQVIVSALFQSLHAFVHRVASAQNQYGRSCFSVLDLLEHLQTVDIGQP
jgi:hypothetical protein